MTQLEDTTDLGSGAPSRRTSATTRVGLAAVVAAPLAGMASTAFYTPITSGLAPEDQDALLLAVAANQGSWLAYGFGLLAMALLTLAWAPAVWAASRHRAPRWAWVAAVAGAVFAMAQMVHLTSWTMLVDAMAQSTDGATATAINAAMDASPLFWAAFLPYLLLALLALPFAAVALWRAGLLPLWSVLAVAALHVAFAVVGTDLPAFNVVYALGVAAALAPALLRTRH